MTLSNEPKPQRCPLCEYRLDESTPVYDENRRPKPYDFSICFNCCGILQFDEHLTLRATSKELLQSVKESEPELYRELTTAVRAVMNAQKERSRVN
jgi:hypothetical protein